MLFLCQDIVTCELVVCFLCIFLIEVFGLFVEFLNLLNDISTNYHLQSCEICVLMGSSTSLWESTHFCSLSKNVKTHFGEVMFT